MLAHGRKVSDMTIAVTLKGYCPDCCSYGTCDCSPEEKEIVALKKRIEELEETIEDYRSEVYWLKDRYED